MKKAIYLSVSLILLTVIFSCKKTTTLAPEISHEEYFPTSEGQWTVYSVRKIQHDIDLDPAHDTSYYLIKEESGDLFLDLEGRENRKIVHYRKATEEDNWVLYDVSYRIVENGRGESILEDNRKIELIFPPRENKSWDVNAYSVVDQKEYEYESVHSDFSIGGFDFDSCLVRVLKSPEHNFIQFIEDRDIYAKHVGLVYKDSKDLQIVEFDKLNILKGAELKYELLTYSN